MPGSFPRSITLSSPRLILWTTSAASTKNRTYARAVHTFRRMWQVPNLEQSSPYSPWHRYATFESVSVYLGNVTVHFQSRNGPLHERVPNISLFECDHVFVCVVGIKRPATSRYRVVWRSSCNCRSTPTSALAKISSLHHNVTCSDFQGVVRFLSHCISTSADQCASGLAILKTSADFGDYLVLWSRRHHFYLHWDGI